MQAGGAVGFGHCGEAISECLVSARVCAADAVDRVSGELQGVHGLGGCLHSAFSQGGDGDRAGVTPSRSANTRVRSRSPGFAPGWGPRSWASPGRSSAHGEGCSGEPASVEHRLECPGRQRAAYSRCEQRGHPYATARPVVRGRRRSAGKTTDADCVFHTHGSDFGALSSQGLREESLPKEDPASRTSNIRRHLGSQRN